MNIKIFIDDNKNNQKREFNDIKILSSSQFKKEINSIEFSKIIILDEKVFNKSKYFIKIKIINEKILVQKIILNNNEITTKPYFDFNFFFNRKSKINALSNIYTNKIILITGAGGSIGSNIVYQLMKTKFKMLFLLDNSEYNLYNLSTRISSKRVVFSLNNFNDKPFMDKLLSNYKFDAVFHAAAFKHVPLSELNPFSAIKNNFINTYWFITQVMRHRVPYFCLVSSDKAVRPTNIMGASKRLAELSLIYLNKSKSNKSTIFNSVRFGNVINSSGSVMPLFMRQIQNNQSLTLTHKKITRYFMTIEEAANLVLNVYKISKGGEVFLLDMGMPIKLLDLAKLMIQFSGKTIKEKGNGDIEIKIIGLRKGEKLYEELLVDEKSIPTKINSIHQSLEK